ALKHQLDLNDEYQLAQLAEQLDLRFIAGQQAVQVWLANEEVSDTIRLQQSGETASKIAVYPAVRQALLARQRAFLQPPGLVADGRDMGTIVFPEAQVKIFLDASPEERARR